MGPMPTVGSLPKVTLAPLRDSTGTFIDNIPLSAEQEAMLRDSPNGFDDYMDR